MTLFLLVYSFCCDSIVCFASSVQQSFLRITLFFSCTLFSATRSFPSLFRSNDFVRCLGVRSSEGVSKSAYWFLPSSTMLLGHSPNIGNSSLGPYIYKRSGTPVQAYIQSLNMLFLFRSLSNCSTWAKRTKRPRSIALYYMRPDFGLAPSKLHLVSLCKPQQGRAKPQWYGLHHRRFKSGESLELDKGKDNA